MALAELKCRVRMNLYSNRGPFDRLAARFLSDQGCKWTDSLLHSNTCFELFPAPAINSASTGVDAAAIVAAVSLEDPVNEVPGNNL